MAPWAWSISGAALVVVAWLFYLARIPREKVPKNFVGTSLIMGTGAAMTVLPALSAFGRGELPGAGATLAAFIAFGLAWFFTWLLRQAPLPASELAVGVGDRLLPFTAPDTDGGSQGPADWQGRRVLFKLFRGHW